MKTKNIENVVNHITALQERLCYCENNLQYIKRLQAFTIIERKTSKVRTIRINPQLQQHIKECYGQINPIGINAPILVSQKGTVFTIQRINVILKEMKKKYRLKVKNFSCHSLRKTFGRQVYNMNSDNSILNDVEVATFLQETPTSSILNLRITSPYVSLSNGIKIGMLVRDVLEKEGVTASASFDEMGETELGALISINFEGIELTDSYWDKEGLTANGMKKIHSLTIDNSSVDLDKSDFKHESEIPCFIP